MGAVSELLKQLDSLHSYDLLNQYAMKSLTIAPDNPESILLADPLPESTGNE